MKKLRKPLSLFLSLLMMISMGFGMNFNAYAATTNCTYDAKTRTLYANGTGVLNTIDVDISDEKWENEIAPKITDLVIGEGITKIAAYLFDSYESLENVTLSSTVEEIGNNAFNGSPVKNINLDNVKIIGQRAFEGTQLSFLEEIDLPNVEYIGAYAFGNAHFKKLVLPNVKTIDSYAFTSTYIETLVANKCETIGSSAFKGCYNLKSVETSAKVISSNAFENCKSLKDLTLSQPETIDDYAFRQCTSLKSVVIPNTVGEIGDYAFSSCSSLKYVVIEPSEKELSLNYTFYDCENLLIAMLPSNVTYIRDVGTFDAFAKKDMYIVAPQDSAAYKYATDEKIKCAAAGTKLTVNFANSNELENVDYIAGDKYGTLPKSTKDVENQDFVGWENEFGIIVGEDDYVVPVDHTLTAVYKGNEYKLTFDPDGGKLIGDTERAVNYGAKVGDFPTVSKTGYIFEGWYDANGNKVESDFVFFYKNNTTLTAHYSPIEYTLQLWTGAGKESRKIDSVVLKYDEEFTLPSLDKYYMYNYKDHRFIGWNLNGTDTYYADGATVKNLIDPTKDSSTVAYLTAKFLAWDEIEIGQMKKIDIKSEGRTPAEHQLKFNVEEAGKYIAKASGWNMTITLKDSSGNVIGTGDNSTYGSIAKVVADLTPGEYTIVINAKSVPCNYNVIVLPTETATVNFDPDGGTVDQTQLVVAANDEYGLLPYPTKSGYDFAGWEDENHNIITNLDIVPTGVSVINLKATWQPVRYTFVFYNMNGTKIYTQTFYYGTRDSLKSADSLNIAEAKPGYDFAGWSTARNSTSVAYSDKQSIYNLYSTSKSVALYPIYIRNNSKLIINFLLDNKVVASQAVDNNATSALKTAKELNVSKTGYTFTGWATSPQGDVAYADGAQYHAASAADSVGLYAVMTPIKYNVEYYDTDGTLLSKTRNIPYDYEFAILNYSDIKSDSDPKLMNVGWATEPNADNYEFKEGSRYKNLASEEGAVIKLYPVLRDAEKFEVKYQLSDTLTVTDIGYFSKAKYEIKSPANLCDYYTDYVIDKYFVGWSVDGSELTMPDLLPGEMIDSIAFKGEDITLYALWETNLVGVTFDNEMAGQTGNVKYLPTDKPVGTLPAGGNFSDNEYDYVFDGWYTAADGGEKVTENHVIGNDAKEPKFYARYTLVPKPQYVVVTIKGSSLGKVTINDTQIDGDYNREVKVKYGSTVYLEADPYDDTDFIGWIVNGKVVSNNYSYSFTATQDVTYEAMFEKYVDDEFTVVFIDMYGNAVSCQTVEDGQNIKIPKAPIYPGYKFVSWSLSNDEIASLKDGATIRGNYRKDNTVTYTVKADGATITVGDKTYQNEASGIAYDTKVTVSKSGTTSWRVDNSVVAYGESYSFFVGSNLELTAYSDKDETVKNQMSIVSTDRPSTEAPDILFIATRVIADGNTVVKQGFVYGMGVTESDLTLENVGKTATAVGSKHGVVKVYYNKNASKQIGLNYGISSMHGKAGARAFVVTKDAAGNETTTYSNVSIYTY